ncbi:MAG: CpaF family protein [Planctomycetota bacterium]|jgi:pilus assembly protein CpaF
MSWFRRTDRSYRELPDEGTLRSSGTAELAPDRGMPEEFQDEASTEAPAPDEVDEPSDNGESDNDDSGDGDSERDVELERWFQALKREVHQQVITDLDISTLGAMNREQLSEEVRNKVTHLCQDRSDLLSAEERERLVVEVLDETFGLGPLEPLLRDMEISDILVNGPKTIYLERHGRLSKSSVTFHDDRHVLQIVQRIVGQMGRRLDETCPMVDGRLADGSRLNAIIPPLALDGPLVSIRRFGARPLLVKDLLANHSITEEMLDFLASCVKARVNILISGGTGSGKTTLLNAMSRYIPAEERVATIEDAAELKLQQPHVVRMETRPPNVEGEGEVTTRDLVRNALRMRPDRIIIGECRGAEALDMLQAMNTGHDGSLTTIHANTPRDALSRLEMMIGMAGFDLPVWVTRRQVASAINLIIQVARLMGGVRKIVKISEITGMESDTISMHDMFEFKQTGLDENRVAQGYYSATGIRPNCLEKLESCGVTVPVEMFERRILRT